MKRVKPPLGGYAKRKPLTYDSHTKKYIRPNFHYPFKNKTSMVKARINYNDYFYKHKIFGRECLFANLPKFPSYIHSRVTRINEKEPETIKWLGTMQADDVLFDIGANIGLYTVAGWARGLEANFADHERFKGNLIYAFEPHFANYFCLNQNIEVNNMQGVFSYCMALGNKNSMHSINLSDPYAGAARNNIDFSTGAFDQGVIEMRMDDVIRIQNIPQPTHLKIDVDGYENNVWEGGKQTLYNAKSILFEIHDNQKHIVNDLLQNGFELKEQHKRRNSDEHNYIFVKNG